MSRFSTLSSLALCAALALAAGCSEDALTSTSSRLVLQKRGNGHVLSTPAGIDCGATCEATFSPGESVTLNAMPDDGATFLGFSGACSGTGACETTLEVDRVVVAEFTVTVTVEVEGGGRVTASLGDLSCPGTCSGQFAPGRELELSATPDAGQRFVGFSGACTGETCKLSPTSNASVVATFAPIPAGPTAPINVTVTGQGTVTSAPAGLACTSSCSASFAEGSTVVLTASPASGFRFGGWGGGVCSGTQNSCSVLVAGATSVSAKFDAIPTGGRCNWAHHVRGANVRGSEREMVGGLDVDASGRLLLTATASSDVTIGNSTVAAPSPYGNLVVAVLDMQGNLVSSFTKGNGGPSGNLSVMIASKAAWMPNGKVAVMGVWSGKQDFGDGTVRISTTGGGGWKTYLGVYSTAGALAWVKEMWSRDAWSPVFGMSLGGLSVSDTGIVTIGGLEGIVTQYGSTGTQRWEKTDGGDVRGLAATANDGVVYAGALAGGGLYTSSGVRTPFNLTGTGESAAMLPDGGTVIAGDFSTGCLSRRSGSTRWDVACGGMMAKHVAYDAQRSSVWVLGTFSGSLTLGGNTITSHGGEDLALAEFALADGAVRSLRGIGGTGTDWAHALTTDSTGRVFVGGEFQEAMDIGLGGGTWNAGGFSDGFVACFSP